MKITSLAVMTFLLVCSGGFLRAQDRPHDHDGRYFDSSHHDYHQWNAQEDTAYRRYLEEHHRKYHDWSKASKREQEDYWKWRHDHPDAH